MTHILRPSRGLVLPPDAGRLSRPSPADRRHMSYWLVGDGNRSAGWTGSPGYGPGPGGGGGVNLAKHNFEDGTLGPFNDQGANLVTVIAEIGRAHV